jgi:hypothetical protein
LQVEGVNGQSTMRFPVIRQLEITGYLLYPGEDGTGLSATFERGVSIIAGINGLGKTTLLSAMLRLLIGPVDVLREDADDVGSTRHELISWRTPGFFRSRVPDEAVTATVAGRLTFGADRVYVERSMRDLRIRSLSHNDVRLNADEDTFQRLMLQMSGVASFYDFHFIVRNLLFYLEDRRPLIWSDDAQFEIVRILFIPGEEASTLSALYDDVKKVDSRYRNLLTETNRSVRRLTEQKRAEGSRQSTMTAYAIQREAYQAAQDQLDRVESRINEAIIKERGLGDEIRRRQLEQETAYREYEGIQQAYFANAFPKAHETFHYMLAHIVANGGCLVCGSAAEQKAAELRQSIENGHCPVCDSPAELQEHVVAAPHVAAERVNKAARDLSAIDAGLGSMRDERLRLMATIDDLLKERRECQEGLEEVHGKIASLGAKLPASTEAISELEASVRVAQEQVSILLKDRTEKITRYRRMMQAASQRIVAAHGQIKEHFQNYVKEFLAETCELNYRSRRRPIGESGQSVDFPGFDVMMTSGVFPDDPQPRFSRADISESQKEFIDLAFRMALIRTAAAEDGGAMLVLETPEASLDSLFIYRAGDLLRNFAEQGGENGNVLIASSNLNDANMIPALLGIDRRPDTPQAEIESRMVNLLRVAAPNAAMAKQGDSYRRQYARATTPNSDRLPDEGTP